MDSLNELKRVMKQNQETWRAIVNAQQQSIELWEQISASKETRIRILQDQITELKKIIELERARK